MNSAELLAILTGENLPKLTGKLEYEERVRARALESCDPELLTNALVERERQIRLLIAKLFNQEFD